MNKHDNPFRDPPWKRRATSDQAPDKIPMLAGRPERETVIDLDDRLNLSIALGTTSNVKEFLEVIA
jgi:hypothetical protein